MDEYVIITIDGQYGGDYYVSEEAAKYITSDGVNRGSSTIYLYPSIRQGSNTPYISIASLSYPVYHPSSSYNTVTITDISSVRFNNRGYFVRDYDIVVISLLAAITIFSTIRVFFRR